MTSVPDFIDTAARLHGDTVAMRFGGQSWTYSQLRERVGVAADQLVGLHHTGRVGVFSANRPGVVIAAHACARAKTSFVPHGWRLTADELEWQITEANVTTLVYDEPRAELAGVMEAKLGLSLIPIAGLENAPTGAISYSPAPLIDLVREAAILFTSGTTGRPKGARITYGNLWYSAAASALYLGHQPGDTWLAALSLHHIGGLSILYRAALGGATVDLHERFEPEAVVAAIQAGSTYVSLVPTMLQRVLDVAGAGVTWPQTLRGVLLGGAAAPIPLVEQCLRLGVPVLPTYGLTETSSQAATLRASEVAGHPGSSGQALPLTELRVVVNGVEAPAGKTGEIEVRGPSVFAGYLDEPCRDPEAWFSTGDTGYLDDEGFLYVVDRRSDLIVSGGENIYPAEIERALLAHPLVRDAAVVGVPDKTWGARPAAAVIWSGAPGQADIELSDFCRTALSPFKVPDRFLEVDGIPRSPAGKLLRRRVRELFEGD
ncbi:MAG: o-succinylbenzoate--CoA ligase [Chloroflexota bacterium]|nr:o-succinylbenzoate--CoA ligase [Chloroflexota bacterium]